MQHTRPLLFFGVSCNHAMKAGCTIATDFDFADFEMADQKELAAIYPQHNNIIKRLSREW